jgi:hypothetical protein
LVTIINKIMPYGHEIIFGVVYRILVLKPEGKGLLGRHRRSWEDNIKMDLEEVV